MDPWAQFQLAKDGGVAGSVRKPDNDQSEGFESKFCAFVGLANAKPLLVYVRSNMMKRCTLDEKLRIPILLHAYLFERP